jgi:hypothetical protein
MKMMNTRIAVILMIGGVAMSLATAARADNASPWVDDLAS